MFPVATAGGGQCIAFPDVCKTPAPPAPPVPVPYLNVGMMLMTNRGTAAKKVKVMSQPVLLLNSVVPVTTGNEGGSVGGVISNLIKGLGRVSKGSMKVSAEGLPVVYLTCTVAQNGMNANAPMGLIAAPSQTKVLVAP
jgi:Domain of unknown function (DUF4150)